MCIARLSSPQMRIAISTHNQRGGEDAGEEKERKRRQQASKQLHFPYWHNGAADGLTLLAIIIIALASGRAACAKERERAMIFSTRGDAGFASLITMRGNF